MNDEVQEVKDKIDIVSFIQAYLPLKKSGRNYRGLCPFHNEKTPSFMVSPDLQIFKCFGCGAGGDALTFLMRREGLEFREALAELAQKVGVKLKSRPSEAPEDKRKERLREANSLAGQFYHYLLTSHRVGKGALDYLKGRGLKPESQKKFLLGYAPSSFRSLTDFLLKKSFSPSEIIEAGLSIKSERDGSLYDRFRGRVMFPLVDTQDRIVGFSGRTLIESKDSPKYLNSPETLIFSKSHFLYGLNLARPSIKKMGQAILVEGQTDLISNVQAGVENIVATSGTALTADHLKVLARLAKELIFCFDNDEAGRKALERGVEMAEGLGLISLVAVLPEGVKDPDEAAQKKLKEWQKSLAKARPFYDYFIDSETRDILKSDSVAKRKASQKILPVLYKISDTIERAHFVKLLAERLDLEERAVEEALARYKEGLKQIRPEGRAVASGPFGVLVGKSEENRLETLRKYLVCLLLRLRPEVTQKSLSRIPKRFFEGSVLSSLYLKTKEALTAARPAHQPVGKSLKIESLRSRLDEAEKAIFEDLILLDLGSLEEDEDLQKREFEVVLMELKKESCRSEIKEVAGKIKAAESEGQKEEVSRLTLLLKKLNEKVED